MQVYIAGPLFSQAERDFNKKLRECLSPYVNTYLPQEDGLLLVDLVKTGTKLSDAVKTVATRDISAIEGCDLFIIVMDGRSIEEGSAFELGMAFEKGKECIGLQTDPRREIFEMNNPMITYACSQIFSDLEGIVSFFKEKTMESRR